MQNEPQIVFENENFIAINKPANLLVHGVATTNPAGKPTTGDTLVDFLVKKYPEIKSVGDDPINRPGIVHRLDKDTSGIILIARNQKYFEYLKKLFQAHNIKKTYLALVWGKLKPPVGGKGIIDKPISLKSGTTKRTVHKGKMTKEAITEYQLVKSVEYKESGIRNQELGNKKQRGEQIFTLLKVMPKTGRTHQIRVHLNSIGHPIVGDVLYGGKKENPFGLQRHFLHAQSIEFNADENHRMEIEAPVPEDLKNVLKSLN